LGGARVDLLIIMDKRRLRAGGGAASFLPFDVPGRFAVAADGPDGSLTLLDESRGLVWLSRPEGTAPVVHLHRVPEVSHLRFTLARRPGGGLALAAYSTSSGELLAGDLDLGRAEVAPLAPLGRLETLSRDKTGACAGATHHLLVELPILVELLGRGGETFASQKVTASAVIDADTGRACVAAVEAVLQKADGGPGSAVLRATLGSGGSASLWSAKGTVRGGCSIAAGESPKGPGEKKR
jgi:hypothetical protein